MILRRFPLLSDPKQLTEAPLIMTRIYLICPAMPGGSLSPGILPLQFFQADGPLQHRSGSSGQAQGKLKGSRGDCKPRRGFSIIIATLHLYAFVCVYIYMYNIIYTYCICLYNNHCIYRYIGVYNIYIYIYTYTNVS